MAYAIIEASGKQLWVEPGRFYDLDRLDADLDQSLTLDKVLLVQDEGAPQIGQPYVAGATVQVTVLSHPRGRKITVYKMKPKKKTRKKQGHRQDLTRVLVESITVGGKVLTANAADLPKSEADIDAAG